MIGMSFQERQHRHLHALGFEGDTCKLIKDALDEAEPEESIADVICSTLSHYGTIQKTPRRNRNESNHSKSHRWSGGEIPTFIESIPLAHQLHDGNSIPVRSRNVQNAKHHLESTPSKRQNRSNHHTIGLR